MSNWYTARTSLLYVGEEATYGAAPVLASTNAFRHMSQKLSFNPRNLAKSPERHSTPDQRTLFTRRQTGSFDVKAMLYPSGTLNTLPESDIVLRNAFGPPTNITLATTVASGAGVSGATVVSAVGLAIGQPVQIGVLGGLLPGLYVRWLTGVAGLALTWAPALPAACAVADTIKGCVGYAFQTALTKSLDIAHYPQSPSAGTPAREALGCVIQKLSLMFDSNLEPMIQITGPSQGFAGVSPTFTPQTKPAAFTTVGAESGIPSGLTGYFQHGATLFEIEKLQIDYELALDLQNTAFGTTKAAAFYRKGVRSVTIKIDGKVSDDLTLWTPALASTSNPCMLQIGLTGGRIFAIYCPNLVFDSVPDIGDNDGDNDWSFTGQALAVAGNDEAVIACA